MKHVVPINPPLNCTIFYQSASSYHQEISVTNNTTSYTIIITLPTTIGRPTTTSVVRFRDFTIATVSPSPTNNYVNVPSINPPPALPSPQAPRLTSTPVQTSVITATLLVFITPAKKPPPRHHEQDNHHHHSNHQQHHPYQHFYHSWHNIYTWWEALGRVGRGDT